MVTYQKAGGPPCAPLNTVTLVVEARHTGTPKFWNPHNEARRHLEAWDSLFSELSHCTNVGWVLAEGDTKG